MKVGPPNGSVTVDMSILSIFTRNERPFTIPSSAAYIGRLLLPVAALSLSKSIDSDSWRAFGCLKILVSYFAPDFMELG